MPFRPGLDDDGPLEDLIGLWRAGSDELGRQIRQVEFGIIGDITRFGSDPNARNSLKRRRIQVQRLRELEHVAAAIIDDAVQGTDRFIQERGFDRIYAAGAGKVQSLPFSFTAPHRAAVGVLAADTFDDVLVATRFISSDAKRYVRDVSRKLTGFKLTGGVPVKEQARRFKQELETEFRRRGMGSVQYVDGSRHSFGEYSEMLLRTKTGVAYNMGTLNQGAAAGIEWYELLDGALCGLTSHHDPELANGMIVSRETAASYPLAHPNCRRSVNPRPDVTKSNRSSARSVQSREARADQAAFEESLRQQASRRQERATRQTRQGPGRPPARNRRPARPTRQRADEQQRRATREGNARRRAKIEAARTESAIARAKLADQRFNSVGDTADIRAGLLDEWQVTPDQYLNARAVTPKIKADIRAAAEREANDIGTWLFDNDLAQMSRPKRLKKKTDIQTGRTSFVREQSGYDFLETLDDAERRRVQARFTDADLFSPDVVAEQVRRKTNLDLSDDEAVDWLIDRWLHEDGLRSLASGRLPKYANADNLIPSEWALDGYDISKLFGVDVETASGHVAQVQAEAGKEAAERILGRPSRGPAPWEMDMGDFLLELESVEDVLSNAPRGSAFESARLRLLELAPSGIDPGGKLNPFELFEEIRITAQNAGLL